MGMARVSLKEVDLSTRVASFGGVYGAMVIPALRGPSDTPFLTTSDTQYLNKYTARGRIEVGSDLSLYSGLAFLERANKLWVKRAINGAMFGGLTAGKDMDPVKLADDADISDPSARAFEDGENLFIYASSEGAWANNIAVKIITESNKILEPNAFILEVYLGENLVTPVETHIASRVLGQKDGKGLNMFVEDLLEASEYIGAISNPLEEETDVPKASDEPVLLGGGDDGLAVTDADMVLALDAFANPNERPVTLFMDGGYAVPAYQKAIDTIAKNRQDSVGILSTPYSAEADADYLNKIVEYRKDTLNLNSSFCGLYTPHLQIQDKFNDRKLWVSPDGAVGGSISFSSQNYEIWYPPAGFKRGVLNVLDTKRRFSDGEMDELQNNQINPIRFISGKGIVTWGQKTLLASASALSGMNVRLLLTVIEPAIKDYLANFLFEINDEANRNLATTQIGAYLDTIQARKGVYAFDVVSDGTNNSDADVDAGRMNVDVFIKPTISTEDIPVRIVITPNSISFDTASNSI